MPASARGRAAIAAAAVALLFLAGLGVVALRSLQQRSELLLHRVEADATERGAREAAWQVLSSLAPDGVREALAQSEPRLELSRQLELWHTKVSLDLIVFDAVGRPLAAAPPELLEQTPRLGADAKVLVLDFSGGLRDPQSRAGRQLDITHDDGTPAATLSALPPAGAGPPPAASPDDLRFFDPLLLSFLAAITLAVVALLAFLVRSTIRLERAQAQRRALVASAGHELRTPLTNLRCQLEAAQDGLSPASPLLLRSLHEETMLLVRLVDDLRDLAAAEAGELRLRRARTPLVEVAARTARAMRAGFDRGAVALEVDVPPTLPPLDADADRLGQVLRNLLDNARRHTPAGGRVRVSARRAGAAVELCVEDTGSGIPAEALPRVFERAVQDRAEPARAGGGSGLGLAIVRSLVEAHGGSVRAENAPGRGALFTLRWPQWEEVS